MTRTVCLVGNGLSIAFNPELTIETLTRTLLASFAGSDNPDLRILAAVGGHDTGFEQLLGPFDAAASLLVALPGFQELIAAQNEEGSLGGSLKRAYDFFTTTYRAGVGNVLDLISELARARIADPHFAGVVGTFCEAVSALGPASHITIATLNYDGLLHAGFLDERPVDSNELWNQNIRRIAQITDLGDGRVESFDHTIVDHQPSPIPSRRLRELHDLMPERLAVLQLHGSLGWLRHPETGEIWKFRLDDMRRLGYWEAWRRGRTVWNPVVVLTDQKTPVVDRYPFRLAYAVLEERLSSAERWLIAGCSLGDEPVRQVLQSALAFRRRRSLAEPRLLVIGNGASQAATDRVKALVDVEDLVVAADPLPSALDGPEWRAWST